MSRYLPRFRGWAALALPIISALVLAFVFPARFIESGVGTWIAEPVTPSAWVLAALLMLLCVGSCVEAFRRGSLPDKIVVFLAAIFTLGLGWQVLEFITLRVRHPAL
jgi:hypothetical protein